MAASTAAAAPPAPTEAAHAGHDMGGMVTGEQMTQLLAAAEHFRGDAPFFLHNADILSDLGSHAIDLAQYLCGPIVRATAATLAPAFLSRLAKS